MNSLLADNKSEAIATAVSFENDMICLVLSDGREVKVPLEFYPKLAGATPDERENYRFIGNGRGIHWESLDEDLSVESIVLGKHSI